MDCSHVFFYFTESSESEIKLEMCSAAQISVQREGLRNKSRGAASLNEYTPVASLCLWVSVLHHRVHLRCCDINMSLSPISPHSLPMCRSLLKVLPSILQKHCCILPDRNTGKDQADVPLTTEHISHTEGDSGSAGEMSGWCCWGDGCSVGGSYLSVYLFLCAYRTSYLILCLYTFPLFCTQSLRWDKLLIPSQGNSLVTAVTVFVAAVFVHYV